MAQTGLTTTTDALGETLGSLLSELAWDEMARPNGPRPTRQAATARPGTTTPTGVEAPPSLPAAMRPWAAVLDALAGRAQRAEPIAVAMPTAVAAPTDAAPAARMSQPANEPWSFVLQRLAGKAGTAAAAKKLSIPVPDGKTPARWQSVAQKSPGETIEQLIGSVDWT